MKKFKTTSPYFSDELDLLETTDRAHADNFNIVSKALYNSIMYLAQELCDFEAIDEAFEQVFGEHEIDPNALSTYDIKNALSSEWHGESSEDVNALDKLEINNSLSSEWHGESSEDVNALSAEEIIKSIT